MKIKIFLLALFSMLIFSCSSSYAEVTTDNNKPSWFLHPLEFQKENNLMDSRCAMQGSDTHINGFAHQKITAISRAMAELAGYQKSEVSSITKDYMDNVGRNSSSAYSLVSVSGQDVSARVLDLWIDENENYLYVFMCTN